MSPMVKIIIKNVECYYNSIKALDSITFEVDEGDFVGIVGPNGSGKTTLLRCLSGILKPKVGYVLIDGEDVSILSRREMAKRVGVVPQESYIGFNFKVLDVVLMGRHPHIRRFESKRDLEIAFRAMEAVKVQHLADRFITNVSGGERRRIIIARALAQEPEILLLDEPTVHLDINHQIEIMELLRKLCDKQGLTVIAVLHDFNLAARYCDSLVMMNRGRIVAIGPCEKVLTSQNIEEAFGVKMIVNRHPVTGFLYLVPLLRGDGNENKPTKKLKVHLICGGGSGGYLMRELVGEGFRLTVGVLNVIDSDYETAKALGVSVVCEAPFSPITDENHQENLKMITAADIVLIADMPFGYMNLKNLEAALEAQKAGKRIVIVAGQPSRSRDYTGGRAKAILERLKEQGAIVVKNGKEAIKIVKSLER